MKLLVVGAGSIGRRHVANACQLEEVFVYDSLRERVDELVQQYGVTACYSFDEAVQVFPRAAIVATPHSSHVAHASRLIESGCDVLVEKPVADQLESACQLVKLARESNRLLKVACNMRFHPGIAMLKKHLPDIGKPLFARAHFGQWLPGMRPGVDYRQLYCAQKKMGGGVVLDNIHEFDYLQWMFGPIKKVQASLAHISDLDLDVEDYASINLLHESGMHSSIQLDYVRLHKRRGCEIVGSEGTLLWESEGTNPEYCRVRLFHQQGDEHQNLFETSDVDTNAMYIILLKRFLGAVNGDVILDLLDGEMAVEELQAALAARSEFNLAESQN